MRSDAAIHVSGLVGDQVGRDEARSPGGGEVVGEPVDAVLHHRVPVGHDEHRGIHAFGHASHGLEPVGEPEPARECALRRSLDHRSVHDRIGVRQAEFEHVDAVLDERHGRLDALVERRESDRQVPDEGAGCLSVAPRDDRSDGSHFAASWS